MGKLSARGVAGLRAPGRYFDGDGLHLLIDSAGRRYWVLRFMKAGRQRDMSLGPERRLSLADARKAAVAARQTLDRGIDPIVARRTQAHRGLSFAEAARHVHAQHRGGWKNGKHQAQWITSLETHAFPRIGDTPVAEITRADVLAVLEPIWLNVPETARRVKQRIGSVIDWAVGAGLREHGIEMRLVAKALPRQPAVDRHLPALRAAAVPAFLRVLQHAPAGPTVRAALELLILTASRPGNIRQMRWEDVDIGQAIWTRPPDQMKRPRAHRVPLPRRAIELLSDLAALRRSDPAGLVFPGLGGRMLSENTLNKAVQALGFEATSHGFRSSFKEWALSAGWPDHLSEAQLAHTDPNKARAAYARQDLLEERRPMMEAWATFVRGEECARSGSRNHSDMISTSHVGR